MAGKPTPGAFTLGDPNNPWLSVGPMNWGGLLNTTPTPGYGLPDVSVGSPNWGGLLNITPQEPVTDERTPLQRLLNIGTPGGQMATQDFPVSVEAQQAQTVRDALLGQSGFSGLDPTAQEFPVNQDLWPGYNYYPETNVNESLDPAGFDATGKFFSDTWNYPPWSDGPPASPEDIAAQRSALDARLGRVSAERGNQMQQFGGDHVRSYDAGQAMPQELFEQAVAQPVAPGSGVGAMQKWLHSPERVQRALADPTNFDPMDQAFAQAAPVADQSESGWEGFLAGIGQAMSRGNFDTNGDMLLAMGGGALSGYLGSQARNRGRQDEYADQMSEYNLRKAGFEGDKAGTRRTEQQQGYDATYEADSNFEAQQRAYGAELGRQAAQDVDTNYQYRRDVANATAAQTNAKRQGQLAWMQQFQPSYKVAPGGQLIIESTDPKTGQRTLKVDNSSVWDAAQARSLARGMGADDGELAKIYGPGPGADSHYSPIWELAVQMAQSPELASQVVPEEEMGRLTQSAMGLGGNDGKLTARYMGNSMYTYLMNMMQTNPAAVDELLMRFGLGGDGGAALGPGGMANGPT